MTSILSPSMSWPTNRKPFSSKWLFSSGFTFTGFENFLQSSIFLTFIKVRSCCSPQSDAGASPLHTLHLHKVSLEWKSDLSSSSAGPETLHVYFLLTQDAASALEDGPSLPQPHGAAHLPRVVFWHIDNLQRSQTVLYMLQQKRGRSLKSRTYHRMAGFWVELCGVGIYKWNRDDDHKFTELFSFNAKVL